MHPQDLKKSRRLRLLAASSIGILAMTSSAVWSQESTDEEDEEALEVEEIVVTGSRISRAPGMEASPVLSIDGDAVKLSGFNNLADFLSDIPALQGSQVPDDTTGAVLGTSGLSLLNLRQLGEQRTLTLIDGRRQVGSDPGTAAVNIDTLNFLMVERTEVLTGGASSIYGADAVSGVVNFVLRKNFEGLELDGQFAIDENGEGQSARFSGIMGGNFANNKGNAMLAFEYRQNEEILQTDLDFFNRNRALVTVDQDAVTVDTDGDGVPDFAPSDGVPNFFLTENAVLNIITNGGLVNTFTNAGQFEFGANGQAIPFNPGTQLPFSDDPESAGLPRTTQIGGTGVLVNELQASLTPDSETYNIQAKSNFEIADGFRTFVDMKYTYIDSQFTFQPSFFSGAPNGIATANADRTLPTAAETFNIGAFTGTDNAFLDPVVGQAIDNGFGIGNIQRFMSEFNRGQNATRQTFRFVGGFEGEYKLPIIEKEWNWDVAVNFSRDDATNRQQNSRLNPNFFASIDAIQINEDDIAAIEAAGNTPTFDVGDIVCRVQFLEQAGLPTTINGVGAVSQNTIDNCVAGNIFGVNSLSQEAIDFASVDLNDKSKTEQLIVSANWSGDLFNLTGAGDIGVAMGYQYRREDSETRPDALPLVVDSFSNAINPTFGRFDVHEGYAEVNVPLIKDMFLIKDLQITGSVRQSDYSTIGATTTWSASGVWRPVDDVVFRGGRSRSVRAPNIGELFQAPAQTFIQIDDPCSQENLNEDPSVAANRIANCQALGVPADFVDPNPNISNPGANGGNPFVEEETSRSYFVGTTITPRWVPGLTLVADFFDIKIDDAIQTIGIQTIVDDCFDAAGGPAENLCNLFTRDANTNEIIDFIQGPVNTAQFKVRGVDFEALYQTELNKWLQPAFNSNFDFGNLRIRVQGTALLKQNDQTDPSDPTTLNMSEGELGTPTYRFNLNTSWNRGPLTIGHQLNWQSSQRIFDEDSFFSTEDQLNSPFAFTGDFSQHDFNITYDFLENYTIRGGITNAFDREPPGFAENNIFDFFGRRFFVGASARF